MKFLSVVLVLVLFLYSCRSNSSDEGTDVVTFIKVSSSETSTIIGNTLIFRATDNLNNDVTDESEFYVNGVLNEHGVQFTPTTDGTFTVVAKMKGFQSKPLPLNVIALSGINFKQRILYEDFTGTWCGNCPIATVRYENLIEQNDRVVFLGVHGPEGTADPYINPTSQGIINAKDIWGYPTILINGKYSWSTSNNNYRDMAFPLSFMQPSSKVGIAINSELNGNALTGEVNVTFAQTYTDVKATVFIVENKLHYPQHNYFNGTGGKPIFYDGVPIVDNYEHHNVVRDRLTAIKGDAIPAAQSKENAIYVKPISYQIPDQFVKNNIRIIVVITDSNGVVINTREADVNTYNNLETI